MDQGSQLIQHLKLLDSFIMCFEARHVLEIYWEFVSLFPHAHYYAYLELCYLRITYLFEEVARGITLKEKLTRVLPSLFLDIIVCLEALKVPNHIIYKSMRVC